MTSVVPQNRKNSFRKYLFNESQDSDIFVPCKGDCSIFSTLYHGEALSWRVRLRADSSVSSIGIKISLDSTRIIYFCRQRGRVVRARDLKSGGHGFKSRSLKCRPLFLGGPYLKSSVMLAASQMVWLPPFGILKPIMFISNISFIQFKCHA